MFDAAAALCGVCTSASFEGQGPMLLEALAANHPDKDEYPVNRLGSSTIDGVYHSDWSDLIPMLINQSTGVAERAYHFHLAMAHALLEQAMRVREKTGSNDVGFAGGVFQNRVLTEKCIALLNEHDFNVTLPLSVPVNDGGISFGQIIEYGYPGPVNSSREHNNND